MRKTIFILSLLVVAILVITACSRNLVEPEVNTQGNGEDDSIDPLSEEPSTDDLDLIADDEVEIGELI